MKANLRSRATVFRSLPSAVCISSVLAAMLAGCVPPPATPGGSPSVPPPTQTTQPPTASRPAPRPATPASQDWRDAPVTPGNWEYAANAAGSTASFGNGLLTMRCDPRANTISLVRAAPARGQQTAVTITTTEGARSLTGRSTTAGIEVTLQARDRLLDSMAVSRGRFAVSAPGEQTLYVPSWTEVTRVIEDCR